MSQLNFLHEADQYSANQGKPLSLALFSRQDKRTTSLAKNQMSKDNTDFEAEHELNPKMHDWRDCKA